MERYPKIELTAQERNQLRELIVNLIIQANLNGVAVALQRYNAPVPIMPSTFGTWLNSGQQMLTSAVRSHMQYTIGLTPHRHDQLIPVMAIITNPTPQGLEVLRSDDDSEIPVDYDTCLLHLFTELMHEISHAITYPQVTTLHKDTLAKDPYDSEKKCNDYEYEMYNKLLDKTLRDKVIKHRLFCHIFREGPEARYNHTINKLLEMHFSQKTEETPPEKENDGIQNTEQKDG
jgi:hypothetical protein